MQFTSLKGHLLVATSDLVDPNFFRTVVLLLEHGEQGALGLVLNRPAAAAPDGGHPPWPLPAWEEYADERRRLFRGGPVEPDAVIGLARCVGSIDPERWNRILHDVGIIDLRADPSTLHGRLRELRVFNGYAGWASAQLEAELAAGGWLVAMAEPGDPFTASPDGLWQRAIVRDPGGPSWMVRGMSGPPLN